MTTIREFTGELTEKQRNDIINLVSKNAETISAYVVQKGSPFYSYVVFREKLRTNTFLDKLFEEEPYKTHLIIAEDISGKIIGYLLYNKDATCCDDVSICSTIVSEKYRRKGIFTKMFNLLTIQAKSISLTCYINKVPFYKKFDFRIEEQFETQVAMTYGSYTGNGEFYGLEDKDIDMMAQKELSRIKNTLGTNFERELDKFNKGNTSEKKKVEGYIKKNLT
jgi:Acetyltransferase (GNAT) domain